MQDKNFYTQNKKMKWKKIRKKYNKKTLTVFFGSGLLACIDRYIYTDISICDLVWKFVRVSLRKRMSKERDMYI